MSGIALIFRRDGMPVSRHDLEAMTAAMAHRAPDGVRLDVHGSVGVGFCSMMTTLGPPGGQPVRCRGGSTIVAIDGRLDDRAGLLHRLGTVVAGDAPDAELLARAVERWGSGFVDRLLGDFAIVVADVTAGRVLCARDHLGVKALYYASLGPLFVAASDVRAVLAHPDVPADLVPAAFERWAANWIIPGGTVYRSISPLPMGSMVVATTNGLLGPSRYWNPSCEPRRFACPGDLVEEYRWLVTEATRDRLRSAGPVVVAMSGGLDSTTVASTALALARQEASTPEVRIGSLVYPGHPRADESVLIDSMERRLGLHVRRVRPMGRTPVELTAEIERYLEPPDVPNDQLGALMRSDLDERVLLTGLGGDDWFYNSVGLDVARAVRHGRLLSAVRAARQGKRDGRHPSAIGAIWSHGLRPLPKGPGALLARSAVLSELIAMRGGKLGARFLEASWRPRGVPRDSAWVLAACQSPVLSGLLAAIERRAADQGFEYRHPFHDVRLVELSLRIPGSLRLLNGDARWLPRQAMAGRLPDDIRLRRAKAEFSVAVREELDAASATGLLERATSASQRSRNAWRDLQVGPVDAWHPRLRRLWSEVVAQLWHDTLGTDLDER